MHLFKQKISVKKKGQKLIIKITGALVNMLMKLDTGKLTGYLVYEKGHREIYVVVLRAIYVMLVVSLLQYQKFKKYLRLILFLFNNYDHFVANIMVN